MLKSFCSFFATKAFVSPGVSYTLTRFFLSAHILFCKPTRIMKKCIKSNSVLD